MEAFQSDREIVGRDQDLAFLKLAWFKLEKGKPLLVTIRADTGIGKTRLIQEFYRWLSCEHDKNNYWPDHLSDTDKAMTIVPEVKDRILSEIPPLPWLWLAARCRDMNKGEMGRWPDVAFDQIRHQLSIHLAGMFQEQKRNSLNASMLKSLFSLLTSFALPGSGSFIEIINALLDGSGDTVTIFDAYKALKDRINNKKIEGNTFDEIFSQERQTIVNSAKHAFRALFTLKHGDGNVKNMVPIIMFIDDAHWVDRITVEILSALLKECGTNSWPLLVITASWDEAIQYPKLGNYGKELTNFLSSFRESANKENVAYHEHMLSPLNTELLSCIVLKRLPNIGIDAAKLLALRCGGDIDLLHDFLDELIQAPGWLKEEDQTLSIDVSELVDLPSKAHEMARRRLNTIGKEIRQTLEWASAQGIEFDEHVISSVLCFTKCDLDAHKALIESDKSYGIIKSSSHEILKLKGEFRRMAFFEVCRDSLNRHPRFREMSEALATVINNIINSSIWLELDSTEKNRIGKNFIELIEELRLKGEPWKSSHTKILIDLAKSRLNFGDTLNARIHAEKLFRISYSCSVDRVTARKLLVQGAYIDGDLEKERRLLVNWKNSREKRHREYFLQQSFYYMRQSKPKLAVSSAKKAINLSSDAHQRIESMISLSVALWSRGFPHQGFEALKKAEAEFDNMNGSQASVSSSIHHTACLVLHDLEKNQQVVHHANKCVEYYRRIGDKQSEIISKVNLGDALWGVGNLKNAIEILNSAYDEANSLKLPHAQDIAAICLANVSATVGAFDKAKSLYDQGVSMAKHIEHDWDTIYGSIYYSLIFHPSSELRIQQLIELSKRAEKSGYHYLQAMALGFATTISAEYPDQIIALKEISKNRQLLKQFPLAYSHFLAASIINDHTHDMSLIRRFISSLSLCEGLKGRKEIINKALSKLENSELLTVIEKEFLIRWRNRFLWDSSEVADVKLRLCDYKLCEARCCYDGVYLSPKEVMYIKEVVKSNRDYFRHLPDNFIINGEWHGSNGPKTAVRAHEYASPDFPEHFSKTRCVFAFEDGACSLESYSVKYTDNPWKYKPLSCWLHPLNIKDGEIVPPPGKEESDPHDIGVSYPGYVTYTPCGQTRSDGLSWSIVLRREIEEWERTRHK